MSNYTVTLTLSDDAYRQAQRLAANASLPIESLLSKQLEAVLDNDAQLPPDEQAELTAMQHLSEDALWTIARERLPQEVDDRQQMLGDRNSRGTISPEEYDELTLLVERGNRLMVRKAEAMALLTKRGHAVNPAQLMG